MKTVRREVLQSTTARCLVRLPGLHPVTVGVAFNLPAHHDVLEFPDRTALQLSARSGKTFKGREVEVHRTRKPMLLNTCRHLLGVGQCRSDRLLEEHRQPTRSGRCSHSRLYPGGTAMATTSRSLHSTSLFHPANASGTPVSRATCWDLSAVLAAIATTSTRASFRSAGNSTVLPYPVPTTPNRIFSLLINIGIWLVLK